MKSEIVSINTPLGEIDFFATTKQGNCSFELVSGELYPVLPEGMSVSGCYGVLLNIEATDDIAGMVFESKIVQKLFLEYSPESGEGLDAQQWENEQSILMIGTEDQDYLSSRLSIDFGPEYYVIDYRPEGLAIELPSLKKGKTASFHFIIAWNPQPEPHDSSCWYAVDYNHSFLKKKLAKI